MAYVIVSAQNYEVVQNAINRHVRSHCKLDLDGACTSKKCLIDDVGWCGQFEDIDW